MPAMDQERPSIRITLPEPTRVAGVLVLLVAMFALMDIFDGRPTYAWPFGLDVEQTPDVAFSALILLAAGCLSLLISFYAGRNRIAFAMSLGFFVMSYDEAFVLHEQLEEKLSIDWQIVYLPIIAIIGVVWLAMFLKVLVPQRARLLWICGALAWVVSQIFEKLQWNGDQFIHPWMVLPEETLEMLGSTAWLLALLICLRQTVANDP